MDKRIMVVGDVMTRKVVTITEDESIGGLLENMENARFHHLPVVRGDKLVGLVTHRDLMRVQASPLADGADATRARARKTPIKDVMKDKVYTVLEDTPLVEAASRMRDDAIGCVPVVDDDGALVGILTSRDLLDLSVRWLGGKSAKA